MDKKDLRHQVRLMKRQFTKEQLLDMSQSVIHELLVVPQVKQAHVILMYYSLDDEVNTHNAVDRLVGMGKIVLLPVVTSATDMELRCYTGPDDLRGGFFNIMEPVGKLYTDYSKIDVAVVPGMSFDLQGNRLGRGKGYYDRFLPLIPQAYKIGICFPFQKFPAIPVGQYDVKMDIVL